MRAILLPFLSIIIIMGSCEEPKTVAVVKEEPANGGLILPDGFEAVVVADSIGPTRHLAVNANGDVYAKLSVATGRDGNMALQDTTMTGGQIYLNASGITPMMVLLQQKCVSTMAICTSVRNWLYIAKN